MSSFVPRSSAPKNKKEEGRLDGIKNIGTMGYIPASREKESERADLARLLIDLTWNYPSVFMVHSDATLGKQHFLQELQRSGPVDSICHVNLSPSVRTLSREKD